TPRANTSIRPGPQETASGPEVSSPPRLSQSCHDPSYHLCHSALSVPTTKTSTRSPLAERTTACGPCTGAATAAGALNPASAHPSSASPTSARARPLHLGILLQ